MVFDEMRHQLLAALSVDLIKAGEQRAVEVEHAQDLPEGGKQRHDQLRARSRIASDMARKIVDVGTRTVAARAAAVPQTPLPSGIRTQAGLPWNGPSTSS